MQRKQTLSEIVSERIKTYITEKECKPGDRLPSEKEIIDMLGVSRTSVREALKSLESQGIIEIKQGVGIFVKEVEIHQYLKQITPFLRFDKRKFKELVDTRVILELGAIELAIQNDNQEKIKQMEYWNELLLEKAKRGEKPKNEDLLFHKTLFEATGNETYIQLSSIVSEYFQANTLEDIVTIEEYETAYNEHKRIIEFLFMKDEKMAKKSLRDHLGHLYERINN